MSGRGRTGAVARRSVVAVAVCLAFLGMSATSAAYRRDGAFEWGFAAYVCEPGGTVLGYLEAKAHAKEYGASGTNYMKVKFIRQYKGEDGLWHADRSAVWKSTAFPDDGANHTFEPTQRFDFAIEDVIAGTSFRVQAQVTWWDRRSGPDLRLAMKRVSGAGCVPKIIPPG